MMQFILLALPDSELMATDEKPSKILISPFTVPVVRSPKSVRPNSRCGCILSEPSVQEARAVHLTRC
jgi:hypothetical protein